MVGSRRRFGLLPVAVGAAVTVVVLAGGIRTLPAEPWLLAPVGMLLLGALVLVGGSWAAAWIERRGHSRVVLGGIGVVVAALAVAGAAVAVPLAEYIAAGLAAGWGMLRRWAWSSVIAVVAVTLAPLAIWLAVATPIEELVTAQVEHERGTIAAALPRDMDGADREAALSEQEQRLDEFARIAVILWPGCIALMLVTVAFAIVAMAYGGVRWLAAGNGARPAVPFERWRLPFGLVWLLVIGLALVVTRQEEARVAGINVVFFAAVLLAVQGVAVQVYVVGRVVGTRWQILFWCVAGVFFARLVLAGGAVLGLADQWFDIRRLGADTKGPRRPIG